MNLKTLLVRRIFYRVVAGATSWPDSDMFPIRKKAARRRSRIFRAGAVVRLSLVTSHPHMYALRPQLRATCTRLSLWYSSGSGNICTTLRDEFQLGLLFSFQSRSQLQHISLNSSRLHVVQGAVFRAADMLMGASPTPGINPRTSLFPIVSSAVTSIKMPSQA